jgi:uncharacterized membrane protein
VRRYKPALKITWREAWPIWLTFGILTGFGTLGVWALIPAAPVPAKTLLPDEDVVVNMEQLQAKQRRIFAYPQESGRSIEFFVEREADGTVIVSFASCRRCYRSGHYRRGDQILCGRCNEPMMRVTARLTPESASDCTQIPIPFEQTGDRLAISANAVHDTFTSWYAPVLLQDENSARRSQE